MADKSLIILFVAALLLIGFSHLVGAQDNAQQDDENQDTQVTTDDTAVCYKNTDCVNHWNKVTWRYEKIGTKCCENKCRDGDCDPLPFDKWHIAVSVPIVVIVALIITGLSIHFCCRIVKKHAMPSVVAGIRSPVPMRLEDMEEADRRHREAVDAADAASSDQMSEASDSIIGGMDLGIGSSRPSSNGTGKGQQLDRGGSFANFYQSQSQSSSNTTLTKRRAAKRSEGAYSKKSGGSKSGTVSLSGTGSGSGSGRGNTPDDDLGSRQRSWELPIHPSLPVPILPNQSDRVGMVVENLDQDD
ncbi:uncharacterized protein LOC142344241 [Convolutriloba macropyga]|uniref:uncharacterized protein LOC142344241 n=1 Tax=Convolutriloba macropyga TaxID=536237 RepID=UPI003F51C837